MSKRSVFLALVAIALLATVTASYLEVKEEPFENRMSPEDIVSMSINVNPEKPDLAVEMRVPAGYLGPRFLNLSTSNLLGGKQKRILVQFYYPSMLPDTPENASLGGKEFLTYASVTSGVPGSTRRIALGDLTDSGVRTARYEPKNRSQCGLSEYTFKKEMPLDRHAFYYMNKSIEGDHDINTYEDNVYSDDVFIVCDLTGTPADGVDRCNFTFDTEKGLSLDLRGVPMSRLCEWSQISMRVRALLDGFVVKGKS